MHGDLRQAKEGLCYVDLHIPQSVDYHLLCPSKGLNSTFAQLCCNSRICRFWRLVVVLKVVEENCFHVTYILANLITNSIHAWLTKDYRSSGMCFVTYPVPIFSKTLLHVLLSYLMASVYLKKIAAICHFSFIHPILFPS